MEDSLEAINSILMVYAIPLSIISLAGIIVLIIGFGKEKKALKIAGIVIAIVGLKCLIMLGCFALYMKFIMSITSNLHN